MTLVRKLLDIASGPISRTEPSREDLPAGSLGNQLHELLVDRNGFYVFESALHVRPAARRTDGAHDISAWNSSELWRHSYQSLIDDRFCFFAEDAFGHQFAIDEAHVFSFNSETGGVRVVVDNIEQWASGVLENYRVATGYPVIHAWQAVHGAIRPGYRLLARVPFVLGGEYVRENVSAIHDVALMRYWGSFANSIRDLADGESFVFDVAGPEDLVRTSAPPP
ncbi:hypothetical protein ABZ780_22660 [Micromonospora sp. NPDC047467]|uniref:hypothetical protein n=1 Tax=Micromonospora sp. NPDC047467 TaxID=3154814 RepID=UPI00340CEAAA